MTYHACYIEENLIFLEWFSFIKLKRFRYKSLSNNISQILNLVFSLNFLQFLNLKIPAKKIFIFLFSNLFSGKLRSNPRNILKKDYIKWFLLYLNILVKPLTSLF